MLYLQVLNVIKYLMVTYKKYRAQEKMSQGKIGGGEGGAHA